MQKQYLGIAVLSTDEWIRKVRMRGSKEGVLHFPPDRSPNIKSLSEGSIVLIYVSEDDSFVGEFKVKKIAKAVSAEEFNTKYRDKAVETEKAPFPRPGQTVRLIEYQDLIIYPRPVKRAECGDLIVKNKPLNEMVFRGFTLLTLDDNVKKLLDCIREKSKLNLIHLNLKELRPEIYLNLKGLGPEELIMLFSLMAGKNVLVVGPPGAGKTRFLLSFLEKLGVNYDMVTGNPEWTYFDAVGGIGINGAVYKGFIFRTVEKANANIKSGKLHWLIIDEINRANLDLALGKFFTLLDPVYRLREALAIDETHSVKVPLSFRVLATMNNYDISILFKLGYALLRRFAVMNFGRTIRYDLEMYRDQLAEDGERECDVGLNFTYVIDEIRLCNSDLPQDCIVIVPELAKMCRDDNVDNCRKDLFKIDKWRLDYILTCVVEEMNEVLDQYDECDICPVSIPPGVVADMLKYIAAGIYAFKKGYVVNANPVKFIYFLLDSAISIYALPQLNALVPYIQRERLGGIQQTGSTVLERMESLLRRRGLLNSADLAVRLRLGKYIT